MKLALVIIVGLSGLVAAPVTTAEQSHAAPAAGAFWALSTRNLQQMTDWYARVFGLRMIHQIDAPDGVAQVRILGNDRLLLELLKHREATPRRSEEAETYRTHGLFKAGIFVDDAADFARRLEMLGIPVKHGLTTSEELRIRYLVVADPEGNLIQICSRL